MHVDTIINSNRSIIVLNGEQPDKRLLTLINTKVPIIAADGAAHRLPACLRYRELRGLSLLLGHYNRVQKERGWHGDAGCG